MPGPDPRKARLMQGPKGGVGKLSPKGKKESVPFVMDPQTGQKIFIMIDDKEYDVSNIGKINKGGKTAKNLQELKPAKPGIGKPTGKIQAFAKGGRAGLKGGGICKKGMNKKAIGRNS